VRARLAAGTLTRDSSDVANALASAHNAIHGIGRRHADSPIFIPRTLPLDKFVERIDEVIQHLRDGLK
jgi:hypothetical protein